MRRPFFVLVLLGALAAVTLFTAETWVTAQEAQRATTGAPTAATPRLSNGHPDLNGYWYRRQAPMTPKRDGQSVIMVDSFASLREIHPGTPKYKPEFVAKVKELEKNQVQEDLTYTCGPPGVPRIGPPQRIVQTAREVVILYDDLNGNFFRMIPTDGRPHRTSRVPNVAGQTDHLEIDPSPHGISVGRWEGDTLVIETTNFSPSRNFYGSEGTFTLVERFTRTADDTIVHTYTVSDPSTWTRPWTVELPMHRINGPMLEYACNENNQDGFATLKNARAQEEGRLAPMDAVKRGDAKATITEREEQGAAKVLGGQDGNK